MMEFIYLLFISRSLKPILQSLLGKILIHKVSSIQSTQDKGYNVNSKNLHVMRLQSTHKHHELRRRDSVYPSASASYHTYLQYHWRDETAGECWQPNRQCSTQYRQWNSTLGCLLQHSNSLHILPRACDNNPHSVHWRVFIFLWQFSVVKRFLYNLQFTSVTWNERPKHAKMFSYKPKIITITLQSLHDYGQKWFILFCLSSVINSNCYDFSASCAWSEQVLTAVTMKNTAFWDVIPCGSCKNRRFRGTYCLHHQDHKNWFARNVSNN
jgi:hypothetical protein